MLSWTIRTIVMSAIHIVARVVLGLVIVASPLHGTAWKTIAVAVVVLVALIWSGIDGIFDGRAHDDPDDYTDLTMRWLKAGIVTGIISAVIGWGLSNYVLPGMGDNSFFLELFAGGSFTALLVFVPATAGSALGRFLAHRGNKKAARDEGIDNRDSTRPGQASHLADA